MGKTFTPLQRNWRFYADDGAEPTSPLANENAKPTLSDNGDILRLRVTIAETGDVTSSGTLTLEYSLNDTDWNSFGPAAHWNYANGQATEGNQITGLKLTDSSVQGEYYESGSASISLTKSTVEESDVAIQATGSVQGNTTYYFRALIGGTAVPLDSGETHPQVLTTTQAEQHSGSGAISGTGSVVAAGKKGGKGSGTISDTGSLVAAGTAYEPPSISSVTPSTFDDKDTGINIGGSNFGSSQGTGKVELGDDSDYGSATLVAQTVTSWGDSSIQFTAVLSTLTPGTLYVFVTTDGSDTTAGYSVTVHRAVAFVLGASANIAASGENTTPQLTPPSGKTTGDFGGGRIQDDENPGDSIPLAVFSAVATDNFNRSDGDVGSDWGSNNTTKSEPVISSNELVHNGSADREVIQWLSDTPNDDQYVQAKIVTLDDQWLALRCQSPSTTSNHYGANIYNDGGTPTIEVFKWVSDTSTKIGTTYTGNFGAGDVIKFAVVGFTFYIYINGVLVWTGTDGTQEYSSGSFGIGTYGTSSKWDDFVGGDVLTTDPYREDEWSIQATTDAEADEQYEFRVLIGGSPVDTYSLYPKWTIGTGDIQGTGAISGTGSVVAAGKKGGKGSGTISDTGSLVAAGKKGAQGAGTIAGTGDLAGTGTAAEAHQGSGAISGTGSVAAAGQKGAQAAGTISDTGSLVAAVEKSAQAAGTASGTGDLVGAVRKDTQGTGTESGTGSVVAAGKKGALGTGAITGSGTVVGTGSTAEAHQGTGSITGSGNLVGAVRKGALAAGTESGTGDVSAAVEKSAQAAGTAAGTGDLVGVAQKDTDGTGAITGSGTVVGTGSSAEAHGGAGAITGSGNLAGTVRKGAQAAGTESGTGDVSAAVEKSAQAAGTIAGTGSLVGTGGQAEAHQGTGAVSGAGSLVAAGKKNGISVTISQDDFNRADEDPLAGGWVGAPGTDYLPKIASNAVRANGWMGGFCVSYFGARKYAKAQFTELEITTTVDPPTLFLRIPSTGTKVNGYAAQISLTPTLNVSFWNIYEDGWAHISPTGYTVNLPSLNVGDVFRFEVDSDKFFRFYQNGILLWTGNDTTGLDHPTGSPGIFPTYPDGEIDNWVGGDVVDIYSKGTLVGTRQKDGKGTGAASGSGALVGEALANRSGDSSIPGTGNLIIFPKKDTGGDAALAAVGVMAAEGTSGTADHGTVRKWGRERFRVIRGSGEGPNPSRLRGPGTGPRNRKR